jgi:hypothetical protein
MTFWAELLIKHFQPLLNKIWVSVSFWRLFSLLLIFILICIFIFRKSLKRVVFKNDYIVHDIKIFNESNAIIDMVDLNYIIDILNGGYISDNNLNLLKKYTRYFNEIQNSYYFKSLRKTNKNFNFHINMILNYIGENFFNDKHDNHRLQPYMKQNNYEEYRKSLDKLLLLIINFNKSFKKYQDMLKRELF